MAETLVTSDGRVYDALIEILDQPELMGSKVVIFALRPHHVNETPIICRLHYHCDFILKRSLDNAALVAEARRELMLFLEGDTENWANPYDNVCAWESF